MLLNSFLGKNFSSINDVVQHPLTGDLWFTDARYAYWQHFGREPQIRPQVYRFEPETGVVQVVADGFVAPSKCFFFFAFFFPFLLNFFHVEKGFIL